jgi:hypothetical protein
MLISELKKHDDDTLVEWGRQRENIIKFMEKHIDTKENASHLLYLIHEYERKSRERSRVTTALWLLRNDLGEYKDD